MNPRIKPYLRATAWGFLLGAVILGFGGRLIMRLIAWHAGLEGGFSWGGTLEVILLGGITGGFAGVFFPIWAQIPLKNWINGVTYGTVVYTAFLILPISGKAAAKGFPEMQLQIYLIFGFLFMGFGAALAYLSMRNSK